MGNITSADTILTIQVATLFETPQQLQGFSTDDIYNVPMIKSVETAMGVDGVLSAGFVFVAVPQEIVLQADSLSNLVFDTWWLQMQAAKFAYPAKGLIKLPAVLTKFTQTKGFLTGYTPIPPGKRTLQPRRYEITWEKVAPAPSA